MWAGQVASNICQGGHRELIDLFMQLSWQERALCGVGDRSACAALQPWGMEALAWLSCWQLTWQTCILKPAQYCVFFWGGVG